MAMKELSSIKNKMKSIDDKVNLLSGGDIPCFFDPITINMQFQSPEARFIQFVAFCYTITHEGSCKINFDFAVEKFDVINKSSASGRSFKINCHALRTVLQHNLNLEEGLDRIKLNLYEDWLDFACGKRKNLRRDDWQASLNALIETADRVLDDIILVLDDIFNLEVEIKRIVMDEWITKLKKHFPIYKYVALADVVFTNFAYRGYDIEKFCKRHYAKWLKELRDYTVDSLEAIAVSQIEREFLSTFEDANLPLPINGSDIMAFFSISPSAEVKTLLIKARTLYIQDPCSKVELLEKLKNHRTSQ